MRVAKPSIRQLQRLGGKYAVIADESSRWFDSLWHGKSLGVTISWLSFGTSLGIFLIAGRLHSD